jgi:hypothetical protein
MEREQANLLVSISERWSLTDLNLFVENLQYFHDRFMFIEYFHGRHGYYNRDYVDEYIKYYIVSNLDKEIVVFDERKGFKKLSSYKKPVLPGFERLQLIRFQYASPGIIDIAGIAEIVNQLKDLLLKIFHFKYWKLDKEYENRRRHLEHLEYELKLTKEIESTLINAGFTPEEAKRVWYTDVNKLNSICDLMEQGKITLIE